MQNSKILLITALSAGSIGLSLASGCSSSSSPKATGGNDAAMEEDTGSSTSSSSSSSSSSGGLAGVTCMNASMCDGGEVCCGSVSLTTTCAAAPCSSGFQVCATDAECGSGNKCNTMSIMGISVGLCGAAGTGDGGGTEGGTTPHDGGGEGGSSGGDSGGADTGAASDAG